MNFYHISYMVDMGNGTPQQGNAYGIGTSDQDALTRMNAALVAGNPLAVLQSWTVDCLYTGIFQ